MPIARPTRARLLAWSLSIASLALFALTITSIWGNMWIAWSDRCVAVFHGQIAFRWGFSNPSLQILSPGCHVRWFDADWEWFRKGYTSQAFNAVNAPLWLAALLLLPAATWSVSYYRAIRGAGRCPKCGYDLAGLGTRTTCPECGRAFARSD